MNDNIKEILYAKDNKEEYHKYQILENSIEESSDLIKYFDTFTDMLNSPLSYIRIRAFRIICKLAKWDIDNKINKKINIILKELDDSKPTNVRQSLSYLNNLLLYKPELKDIVIKKINQINLNNYKDTMSPLIKKDIDYLLNHI